MQGRRRIGLVIGLLIACGTASGVDAPKLPDEVEKILWWFPEDTQTVLFDHDALVEKFVDGDAEAGTTTVQAMVEWASRGRTLDWGALGKNTVVLTVGGSRRFRVPEGFGAMTNEGASVVLFRGDLGAVIDVLAKGADREEAIAGRRVAVFEDNPNNDLGATYYAQPKPNILIAANHRGYLKEMLTRIDAKPRARALPAALPEWTHLDPTAPIWAVRHYDPKDARNDPTSPIGGKKAANSFEDEKAKGLVVAITNEGARVTYLSTNPDAHEFAGRAWTGPEAGVRAEVKRRAPNAVDITVHHKKGPKSRSMFLLLFMTAIGHGAFF